MNSWLYTSFKAYAARENIQLLRDDMNFIETCLGKIPEHAHRKLMHQYIKIWQECVIDISDKIKAQNIGRFNANQFLREQSE